MERHVKERLVGAAVLVALAVILIPELLSGPGSERKVVDAPDPRAESGVKTYQFDLDERGSANGKFTTTPAPPSEQSPPPEEPTQSSPEPQATPAPSAEEGAPTASSASADEEVDERPGASDTPATTSAAPPKATPAAPTPAAPVKSATSSAQPPGWAVQLGSFADQERAGRLVQRMQAAGHQSYLVPLRRADGKVLQRVRIGPYSQREAAEAVLKQVAAEAKGAAIVSQP